MKKIELNQSYSCSAKQVLELYLDGEKAKQRALSGAIEAEIVSFEKGDNSAKLVIQRLVDVELPSFAKKFLPPKNTLIETNSWSEINDAPYFCEYTVEIKKTPVAIKGTIALEDSDSGCQQFVTAEITAKVPLIGKKLEEFVAENTQKNIEAEFAWLRSQTNS